MTFHYVNLDQAIEKHDEVIKKSGGLLGMRDKPGLNATLEFVKDDNYYPEFFDKLTYLMYAINKNHHFVDGNKRASIVISAYFLEINFFDQFFVDIFIKESENLALLIAQNYLNKELLKRILRELVVDGELSEETKIDYATIDIGEKNDY